ncbi:MAG TPA: hypothetical protein PLF89_15340 [bacterium]|nr:hypothetical protein [bacterium]
MPDDAYVVAVDSNGILYAGTYNGLYRSINDGHDWQYFALRDSLIRTVACSGTGDILASTSKNLFLLNENRQDWIPVNEDGKQ